MKFISLSYVFFILFIVYVSHTIWVIVDMFIPPKCGRGDTCYASYLQNKPKQNLVLYTSVRENSYLESSTSDSVTKVHTSLNFNYLETKSYDITLKISQKTRQNGTLFMHAVLVDDNKLYKSFDELLSTDLIHTFPLVSYAVPKDEYYNLLHKAENDNVKVKRKVNNLQKTYSHISTVVPISILSDDLKLPTNKVPGELYPYFKLRNMKFLPILQHNILKSRLSHLQLLNSSTTEVNVTVTVAPASYGTIRLTAQVGMAAHSLKAMGFTDKDVDEVKGIFGDTNIYLLSGTIFISSIHLLFDFLAFKNDVSFWRRKKSMVGLSVRTIYWRAFSQCVIFLYLLDEKTTLIVLIPAGISTAIELWKVSKVQHIHFEFRGWRIRVWRERGADAAESGTALADREAMRYLAKLLYPLCIAGAIYSLVYESHKSWYSWAVHSTVNGVYAFGFLFMLPQLFVNYRLRSVAALPWRAFMYKAFNTVIDDVFAFIITMPTAHRVACFRDDLVFSIYLYQRWLYPVDKTRTDNAESIEESPDVGEVKQKTE